LTLILVLTKNRNFQLSVPLFTFPAAVIQLYERFRFHSYFKHSTMITFIIRLKSCDDYDGISLSTKFPESPNVLEVLPYDHMLSAKSPSVVETQSPTEMIVLPSNIARIDIHPKRNPGCISDWEPALNYGEDFFTADEEGRNLLNGQNGLFYI